MHQRVVGVVENMSYLDTGDGQRLEVFGSGGAQRVAATLSGRFGYDVPLLGEIPHRKRGHDHGLPVRDEPAGVTGEAFRRLRTNLGFMELCDRRSLVFAAVADQRNSVHVPTNLAYSLAQAGWRVLLVDLDLRRSTVGDAIGIRGGTGLADVLLGHAELPSVLRETTDPRLRVVLSGTVQTGPSDLLSGPVMNNVLRRMEQEYDYVVLHAPPVLSYTDAAVVSRAATGAFLTVAVGRTRSHELTTALSAMEKAQVKPLGLVLTGTTLLDGLAAFIGSGFRRRRQSADAPDAASGSAIRPQVVPVRTVPRKPTGPPRISTQNPPNAQGFPTTQNHPNGSNAPHPPAPRPAPQRTPPASPHQPTTPEPQGTAPAPMADKRKRPALTGSAERRPEPTDPSRQAPDTRFDGPA